MFMIKLRMMGWWSLIRATSSETSTKSSNIGIQKWIIKTLRVIIGVKQNWGSCKVGTVVTRNDR